MPKEESTASSATIGIRCPVSGLVTLRPIRCEYLSSAGLTANPVSPSIVSKRVVATGRVTSSGEAKIYKIKIIITIINNRETKIIIRKKKVSN